jgi:excisionase family DNA binding protein
MIREQGSPEVGSGYVDIGQLAADLRISVQTVRRMVKAGDLPQPELFGRLQRWNRDVVGKFLADRRANSERRAAR